MSITCSPLSTAIVRSDVTQPDQDTVRLHPHLMRQAVTVDAYHDLSDISNAESLASKLTSVRMAKHQTRT